MSHESIIATIQKFIAQDRLPHLLFYGPPGTGKTSTIKACAKQMYGPNYKSMVLELNASDDRGIGIVRNQIKTFASTRTVFRSGCKLIILDEADAMTNDAQAALRRVIEQYTKNTRFCLICNYVSKILPALQSRCTRFRFAPLQLSELQEQVERVVKAEGLTLTDDGMSALTRLADGDMRKALNILQSTSMAFDTLDARSVYTCTATPQPEDIQSIMSWMLEKSIAESYHLIMAIKTDQGLALQDILKGIHELSHSSVPLSFFLSLPQSLSQSLSLSVSSVVSQPCLFFSHT
eukprot:m.84492 g.84492  ORF g.84492 m.84492 type:complete len:292 (+) comp14688_c0_seq3:102-977(+)